MRREAKDIDCSRYLIESARKWPNRQRIRTIHYDIYGNLTVTLKKPSLYWRALDFVRWTLDFFK